MGSIKSTDNTISILGCGWYGLELAKQLRAGHFQVKGSTTSTNKLAQLAGAGIEPYLVDFREDHTTYDPEFFKSQTLVISIPPKRSTNEQASFVKKIAAISDAANNQIIKNILFISSTAVYANANEKVDESTSPNPETASGKAILVAETMLQDQEAFSTTVLRFAGLVGPGRDPARFFAGKTEVQNGLAPINLIHLKDCIGLTMKIIKEDLFGYTVNGCCPDHPAKQDFYTIASLRSGLTKPTFINELTNWKIVSSNPALPTSNYKYLIDNWTDWLAQDKL